MKSWRLDNGFLQLSDDGKIRPVTADEIFRAVLENDSPWTDLPPGKTGDAAQLNFSRYPASLVLVLTDCDEGTLPHIGYELRTGASNAFPVSSNILVHGHAVVGGTWFPILPETLNEVTALAKITGAGPDSRLSALRALLNLRAAAARGEPVVDRLSPDALSAEKLAGRSGAAPEGVRANLYHYQTEGWRWLSFIIREGLGGLLADEMGLGKTLQVISALRDPGTGKKMSQCLVVAPGSLLENWRREISKFAPDLKVLKHHGALRTGRPAELTGYDVVIISYDSVIRDLSLIKMITWSVVILDEAQNIKNPDALRTRYVKEIPRVCGLAMTGTPVENRLSDLWSIMDFAVPGYLGGLSEFQRTYDESPDGASKLEPLVSPLMLRRMVADVATDLPERIDIPEVIELTDEEADAYEKIRQDIIAKHGQAATLVSLTVLRQFCAHPALVEANTLPPGEFSKFQRLRELLTEISASNEKVIVFTSYTEMADRIVEAVRSGLKIPADTLDGRLAIDARQPLIDRFSATDGAAVLVLNPRAGGSGLNITAANHVIHYNLEWNPALEDQASARAHRRGQTRPVTVHRLFCAGTVEEVVDARTQAKREIFSGAVVGVRGAEADYRDILAALQSSPVRERASK